MIWVETTKNTYLCQDVVAGVGALEGFNDSVVK